jgi:hypothetical protein
VQRSAGAVKAESLGRALMNAQIEGPLSAANRKTFAHSELCTGIRS